MELRIPLILTIFTICVFTGQGTTITDPRTVTSFDESPERPKHIVSSLMPPYTATQSSSRAKTSTPIVLVNNPSTALQAASTTLNLASMVKTLLKDKRSSKKVFLLPGRVFMLPTNAVLKGRRRYGGGSMGNKGNKGVNMIMQYNDAGGGGNGFYNEGNSENNLDGHNYENEGEYDAMGNDAYDNDNQGYHEEDDDDDEDDIEDGNGMKAAGYNQNSGDAGHNQQGSGNINSEGYHGDNYNNEGYQTDNNNNGAYQGDNGNAGGSENYENQHGMPDGDVQVQFDGGEGKGQQYGNHASMILGDVPSNDIGQGSPGHENIPMDGIQFQKNYDTLFREYVLNFFIRKYKLKTEMPPSP